MQCSLVEALLTDSYQLTMAYGYWLHGRAEEPCAFEMFFRKAPFGGTFAVFAGLGDFLGFLAEMKFSSDDVEFLSGQYPEMDPKFFDWLSRVDNSTVTVTAVREGTLVFPVLPLVTIGGPLAVVQLLETVLLNLTNFASLVCTNALRHRLAAGPGPTLLELGLRRAQGPNGAMTASRFAYVGGFDATSNVLAAKLYGVPLRGTTAHSFVQSYLPEQLQTLERTLKDAAGETRDFVAAVLEHREQLGFESTNEGELAAFVAFARSFPGRFIALVDTYDVLRSGVPNFIAVALALTDFGYAPRGIRLDSGDLAALSVAARRMLTDAADKSGRPEIAESRIVVSNDINEEILEELGRTEHAIDDFGIGTNLVTCQKQPALGGVFKLVEVDGRPRMKFAAGKHTVPCAKQIYRLVGEDGRARLDVLQLDTEEPPLVGVEQTFFDARELNCSLTVAPHRVEPVQRVVWTKGAPVPEEERSLEAVRSWVATQVSSSFRPETTRLQSPSTYVVALSPKLQRVTKELMHELETGSL